MSDLIGLSIEGRIATPSWAAGGGFLNVTERPAPLEEILPPDTCARLAEVKRRWDPHGMIRANHEISVTPA
jgi:hypothetical protein